MDKLRFGTAGIPLATNTNTDTLEGIKKARELDLDCLELEFVRSIYVTKEKAPLIKNEAAKRDIVLSSHAPYFINLNSNEKKKFYASIGYIKNSAIITSLCGGYSVCFHAGYYLKEDKNKVYEKIKEAIKLIVNEVSQYDKKIWIRPEISGKPVQFGDLKELVKLSQEIEQVMPCIDFAHLHSRSNGKVNSTEEFKEVLAYIEKELGKMALDNMHIHLSGIEYSEKGERNHLNLKDSDLRYEELLNIWKGFKIKGVVISESPNIEEDSMLLKKVYYK